MPVIRLSVRRAAGENASVEVDAAATVADLKGLLEERTGVPAAQQRIIHKGRVLSDAGTLEHFGVADGDAVHLVPQAAPKADQQQQQQQQQQASVPSQTGGLPGGLPPGLAGMPGMEMFSQNPELLRNMMDSPMVKSLMENPEMLRSMLMADPRMRALMESNPQLSHVLNDPELLRQSMSAARNPAVMQEMMRNQDRAMANIESLPGGYNALRRMYQDVQEPMMEAAERAASGETPPVAGGSGGTASGETPQRTPMPNPWGAPTPAAGAGTGAGNAPTGAADGNPFGNLMQMMSAMRPPADGAAAAGGTAGASSNPFGSLMDIMSSLPLGPAGAGAGAGAGANPFSFGLGAPAAAPPPAGPTADGPNPWAPPDSADSPEQRYKEQLAQLESMGFTDKKANVHALLRHGGNVDEAIESLLSDM